ncbi:HCL345Wp [Eremothecium sinecaudum]|uniref:HCL345Wp n=1 Tax=Eremothecium sinecaudum TaxID=45286 RepID=A0A109UWF1_9SACH|nr:HCL345Wp [Eremothecium sinecaudum]AMD19806.1 HCL345Wp [Eremothecium sinecaudum]
MSDNKIDESVDKTRDGAKHFIDKASEESKKLAKDAKRGLEKGESELHKAWNKLREWIEKSASLTAKVGCDAAANTAEITKNVASRAYVEMQNPVVALNTLLGGGALLYTLYGYAEHQSRYLRGKSDRAILATVGTLTAFLVADGVLSYKYYKQLDKK